VEPASSENIARGSNKQRKTFHESGVSGDSEEKHVFFGQKVAVVFIYEDKKSSSMARIEVRLHFDAVSGIPMLGNRYSYHLHTFHQHLMSCQGWFPASS